MNDEVILKASEITHCPKCGHLVVAFDKIVHQYSDRSGTEKKFFTGLECSACKKQWHIRSVEKAELAWPK